MDMHFDGVIFTTHALELSKRVERPWPPFVLVDIRSAAEYAAGHIDGAVHATVQTLRNGELPGGAEANTEFVVVGSGPGDPEIRAAALLLQRAGARRIVELAGGMLAWTHGRYPVTRSNAA